MEIIYQDDSIVVVNKPTGLLTIRDGYDPDLPTVKSTLEKSFGRCWIVHRLDKETSGVLLVARNPSSHRFINSSFENHEIKKKYHAIIHGNPLTDSFVIDQPLLINGDRRHRTIIDPSHGKPAQTQVTILAHYCNHSLVEVTPLSGYTHQIRAHLAFFGHPILGDALYTKRDVISTSLEVSQIQRTALHAYQITFQHPSTTEWLTFQAIYPPDFQHAIDTLKQISG